MSETDSPPDVLSSDDDGSSVEIIVDNTDGPHHNAAKSAGADSCDTDSSDEDDDSDGDGVDVVTNGVKISNIGPVQANNGLRKAAGNASQTFDFRKLLVSRFLLIDKRCTTSYVLIAFAVWSQS